MGAYFSGVEHGLLPSLRAECDVVIVENWCYKFAAKMLLKGRDTAALRHSLPLNACLDAVFLVDTPLELAWQRGSDFSFVELGGQDGYQSLGRESFIDYQGRVRSRLLEFADERWHRIENDGRLDAGTGVVEAVLLPLLAGRTAR